MSACDLPFDSDDHKVVGVGRYRREVGVYKVS